MIFATKSINKGLTISTGWNLGKIIRSIHLFEPFASMPINGTNNKNTNETKNKGINNLWILFLRWIDITNNNIREIKTKIKCFMKKK